MAAEPRVEIWLGRLLISLPPLIKAGAAPTAVRLPRVTMNGGSLRRVMMYPLTNPMNAPSASATAKPTTVVKRLFSWLESIDCMTAPETMPVKPSTAPTERSMPPVRITNVSPTARIRNSTAYWEVFSQLARVNRSWLGESRPNTRIMSTSTPTIQKSPTLSTAPSQAERSVAARPPARRSGTPCPSGRGRPGA